ncbi:cytochrome P450 [Funiculus sociatus]|uniref:cytochrome P450 n=1 Tax=Funiculus sociatus TaxID=450527 RepID=UPI003299D78E
MPYPEQIFCEIERLHPRVGGGFRGVVKPFEFKGYHVPAGWMALDSILETHPIPTIYLEPERFDPDCFSPQGQEHKQRPFSLMGFGAGPRICVGIAFAKMEMKIVAAHLLRGYQWELVPNQSLDSVQVPPVAPKMGCAFIYQQL